MASDDALPKMTIRDNPLDIDENHLTPDPVLTKFHGKQINSYEEGFLKRQYGDGEDVDRRAKVARRNFVNVLRRTGGIHYKESSCPLNINKRNVDATIARMDSGLSKMYPELKLKPRGSYTDDERDILGPLANEYLHFLRMRKNESINENKSLRERFKRRRVAAAKELEGVRQEKEEIREIKRMHPELKEQITSIYHRLGVDCVRYALDFTDADPGETTRLTTICDYAGRNGGVELLQNLMENGDFQTIYRMGKEKPLELLKCGNGLSKIFVQLLKEKREYQAFEFADAFYMVKDIPLGQEALRCLGENGRNNILLSSEIAKYFERVNPYPRGEKLQKGLLKFVANGEFNKVVRVANKFIETQRAKHTPN